MLTDEQIVESVQTRDDPESDADGTLVDDDDAGEAPIPDPPTIKATRDAVDVIRRFALTLPESSESEDVLDMTQKLELFLIKEAPKHLKQSSILDFMQA